MEIEKSEAGGAIDELARFRAGTLDGDGSSPTSR